MLKDEGPSGGTQRVRLRRALVIGQVALATVLLVGAGLLVQTVRKLQAGPGFDKDSRTLVCVSADAHALMPAIRRVVAEIDPNVPMSEDHPLSDRIGYLFQRQRIGQWLLLAIGALALLLSAVGLYGVLAFNVVQRTREIGIRLALGARSADVTRLVVGDGAWLTARGAHLAARGDAARLGGRPPHSSPPWRATRRERAAELPILTFGCARPNH